MNTKFQFEMLSGPTPGKIYPIDGEQVIGGRDTSADIVINDKEISRKHFRLIRSEPGYLVEDLGSTNGIMINGEKISSPQGLHGGEKLSLGVNVVLLYNAIPNDKDMTIASQSTASDPLKGEMDENRLNPEPAVSMDEINEPIVDQTEKEFEYLSESEPIEESLRSELIAEPIEGKSKNKRIILLILIAILLIISILTIQYLINAPVSFWCSNFSFYFKPEFYPQCAP